MEIKVNGQFVGTGNFSDNDAERLWQAMSEELNLVDQGDEERLIKWQDLPDDNIEVLLNAAKAKGFIDDFEIIE